MSTMRNAALLTAALLLLVSPRIAQADSPACEPLTLGATAATRSPLPIDARILARPQGCWGMPETSIVELRASGAPTAVAVDPSFVVTNSTGDWYAIKPRADLEPDTVYTLTLRAAGGAKASLELTTTRERTVTTTSLPKVVVTSAEYIPRVNGAGNVQAIYQLALSMPEGKPGGAFYLNGRSVVTSVNPVANGTPLPRLESDALVPVTGAQAVSITESRLIKAGSEACFTVTYEDAAGQMTASSASSCFVAVKGPDEPSAPEQDGASSGTNDSGCATATARPGSVGLTSGVLAALALLGMRRRSTRARRAPLAR